MNPDLTEATFRFSLSFAGKIWQVVLCQQTSKLIVEARNESDQTITYHVINLKMGEIVHSFTIAESDWWTNVLLYKDPYLVLEQYGDPNDPSVKSILVYNLEMGALEVSIPQFQYESIAKNELIGVDPKDPKIKKNYALTQHSNGAFLDLKSPVYYSNGSESCQLVEEYLELTSSGIGCEYLEEEELIIICYYVRLGTKFDRWLKVIKGGEEIYHEKIDQELNGFASGSFFLFDKLLVFIENGKKLNGIEV